MSISNLFISILRYRDKASKDADSVYKRAQQLLRQLNQSPDSISEQDVKSFCKHASDLRILRTSFIESEYKDRSYNSSYIGMFYVCFYIFTLVYLLTRPCQNIGSFFKAMIGFHCFNS